MTIKENETQQQKADRLGAVDKIQKEAAWKMIIVTLICLLLFILAVLIVNLKTGGSEATNIGNPYECSECKELKRACKKHKEYDADADLQNKIKNMLYSYKYKADNKLDKYIFYYYGESYFNTECDFCRELGKECNGCKYTREAIAKYIEEILKYQDYKEYQRIMGLDDSEHSSIIPGQETPDKSSVDVQDFIQFRLCDECRELGYPYCNTDIEFVTSLVFAKIKNK